MAHPGYGRDGRRLNYLRDMDPSAIEIELISDGITGFPTDLRRYIEAIAVLAVAANRPAEDVHRMIVDEVFKVTGQPMPETTS